MSIIDGLRDRVDELERAVGTARAAEGVGRLRAELAAVRVTQEELRRDLDRLAAEVKQALGGVTAAIARGSGGAVKGTTAAAKPAVKNAGAPAPTQPGTPAAAGAGAPVKN